MKRKLLIIEDDKDIQNYYTFLFAGLDFDIRPAFSGEEALEFLGREKDVDLILLDVVLPGDRRSSGCVHERHSGGGSPGDHLWGSRGRCLYMTGAGRLAPGTGKGG